MRTHKILILFAASFLSLLCACTTDNPFGDWQQGGGPGFGPGGQGGLGGNGGMSGNLIDLGTLSSFDVTMDSSPLTETEVIPTDESDPYYNEYIENNFEPKNTTTITFADGGVVTDNVVKGDTITADGARVTVKAHSKGLTLKVIGTTTNGSLRIYSEKKFSLLLSDVTITNPEGAAINIQNGNCFVQLEGKSTLADGASATYAKTNEEDEKAVFFSEDDLRFSGKGSLEITCNNLAGKSGIASDDALFFRPGIDIQVKSSASAGHGIKANDAIVVKGGMFNIQTEGAGKKAFTSDGAGNFDGGRIVAITKGGVDASDSSDLSGAACIKTDSTLVVTGGELRLKSTGQGGKGISCDQNLHIKGGDIYIITTGNMYGTSSSGNMRPGGWGGNASSNADTSVSPKGIKGDMDVVISGGNVFVRTSGTNGEGIESKATLSVNGGNVAISAYDDGMNAAKAIEVSGGRVFSVSNGVGDGIDSNGSISATGGVMIGIASTMGSEEGIDLENSTFTISNATVISIGGGMGGGMGARYSGHYVSTTLTGNAGTYIALTEGSTPLMVFQLPRTCNGTSLLLSSPKLTSGTYTLASGIEPKGGQLWMNLYENATSVSGGTSASVKAN